MKKSNRNVMRDTPGDLAAVLCSACFQQRCGGGVKVTYSKTHGHLDFHSPSLDYVQMKIDRNMIFMFGKTKYLKMS